MTTIAILWNHSDPRGMAPACDAAIARASAGRWGTGEATELADVRALVALTIGLYDELSKSPPIEQGGSGSSGAALPVTYLEADRGVADYSSPERARAAQIAMLTWDVIAAKTAQSLGPIAAIPVGTVYTTIGSSVPSYVYPVEVKQANGLAAAPAFFLGGGIAVAGIAVAAAWAYCTRSGERVALAAQQNDTLTKALLSTHSSVLQMLDAHRAQEKALGKEIPWSPAEQSVLDSLTKAQQQAMDSTAKINTSASSSDGGFLGNLGSGWPVLAGVVIAGMLLSKRS